MVQRDASEGEEISYSDEEDDDEEEDDEEEDVRSRLLEVSVSDRLPPGYPPLTKHQLRQHRDALSVSVLSGQLIQDVLLHNRPLQLFTCVDARPRKSASSNDVICCMQTKSDQSKELKLHKSSNIGVTRGLMACLKSRVWLNDEVMNLFMGLLQVGPRS